MVILPPSPRVYVVGLPVWVSVADDGQVTFDVDLSEASEAPTDDSTPLYDDNGLVVIPPDVRDMDSQRITLALVRKSFTVNGRTS